MEHGFWPPPPHTQFLQVQVVRLRTISNILVIQDHTEPIGMWYYQEGIKFVTSCVSYRVLRDQTPKPLKCLPCSSLSLTVLHYWEQPTHSHLEHSAPFQRDSHCAQVSFRYTNSTPFRATDAATQVFVIRSEPKLLLIRYFEWCPVARTLFQH